MDNDILKFTRVSPIITRRNKKIATQYLNFVGKSRYIKYIYQPDDAFGASAFKVPVYLEGEELERYKKSGIQVNIKEDENGQYVIFRRDEAKLINKNLVHFTPPYIKHRDTSYIISYIDDRTNLPIRQYENPADKVHIKRVGSPFLIGNGSVIEVNVCVFDTKYKGKGHRLEGIKVLDLIEYHPEVEPQGEVVQNPAIVNMDEQRIVNKVQDKVMPF